MLDSKSVLCDVGMAIFYGSTSIQKDIDLRKNLVTSPHVIVAKLCVLVKNRELRVNKVKHLVLDECNKVSKPTGMVGHSWFL